MGVPPRRENVFFVRSPKALEVVKFRIYSESIYSVFTHFNGKKTCPCYLNRDLCDPKHSILNLRWKGYVFGWNDSAHCLEWLQLTQECANQLLDQLGEAATLRGLLIQATRTKSKQGRMNCSILNSYGQIDPMRIRTDPPLRLSLFNVWGLEPTSHPFTTTIEELHAPPPQLRLAE